MPNGFKDSFDAFITFAKDKEKVTLLSLENDTVIVKTKSIWDKIWGAILRFFGKEALDRRSLPKVVAHLEKLLTEHVLTNLSTQYKNVIIHATYDIFPCRHITDFGGEIKEYRDAIIRIRKQI